MIYNLSPAWQGLAAAALLAAAHLTIAAPQAHAQVFGSGPSDSSLFTNGVFNVPPDFAPRSVSDLQQLNLGEGGILRALFRASLGSEVNVSGGTVGFGFSASSGSEVNISGGTVENQFDAYPGSEVNISGGTIRDFFIAFSRSDVNIGGGTFGDVFRASSGSEVELVGGEFRLNGSLYQNTNITLGTGDVFTGTLADGSTFIFSSQAGDTLNGVTLTAPPLSLLPADPTLIVVTAPVTGGPSGLRTGQHLTLQADGVLGKNFAVVDAVLSIVGGELGEDAEVAGGIVNISGGTIGHSFDAYSGSEVNISGGTVGSFFDANSGSEVNITGGTFGTFFLADSGSVVNISGGTFGDRFNARSESEVNLFGTDFTLDGILIDDLVIGEAFTINDRDMTLAGVFADGTPFSFDLNSTTGPHDYFSPGAMLNIAMVPEPGALALIAVGGVGLLARRHQHRCKA